MADKESFQPEFGSDEWLAERLKDMLLLARDAAVSVYVRIANDANLQIDFDAYSYVIISKRQKRVWRLLEWLCPTLDWLSLDREAGTIQIKPSCDRPYGYEQPEADCEIARVLRDGGIDARQETRYRG